MIVAISWVVDSTEMVVKSVDCVASCPGIFECLFIGRPFVCFSNFLNVTRCVVVKHGQFVGVAEGTDTPQLGSQAIQLLLHFSGASTAKSQPDDVLHEEQDRRC